MQRYFLPQHRITDSTDKNQIIVQEVRFECNNVISKIETIQMQKQKKIY